MKLGIALVLLSTLAFADARAPLVKITVDVTNGSPPIVTRPVLKPEIDAESMMSITSLIGNIRPEHELILQELIKNTPDTDREEKSDYYFRLGELYAKQYRFWRLKTLEGKDPDASSKAFDYLSKMMKTYGDLFANKAFRDYPKMDMALLYYAYTTTSAQQLKEARVALDRLLKEYPTSRYIPDAHLAFAEHHYQFNQFADAESRYKLVLKFPKASVYWFAMYKLGWIQLQQKRYAEAFALFAQVIDGTKNDRKVAPLHAASTKAFHRAVAEHAKPDAAFATFKKLDGATAVDQMIALAELYTSEGFPERARGVYRELTTKQSTDPRFCEWQSAHARATASMVEGGTLRPVDVCQTEVAAFVVWARARRLSVR